ncbi:MAG: 4'-phosphopantetheinyl transferase family protein [Flavisolibacter sp.]
MPIFFEQAISTDTKLAIWKIEEPEGFFNVPLQRSITHLHKRLQHLAGRYLLKHLFPEFPLDQILIPDTRKPYLKDEAFHFSISHCGDYAAAIVSRSKRVGVDIEIPTEKVLKIRHKFLHPDELKMFETGPEEPLRRLTLLWSCKEAIFKWWSFGGVDFSEMIRIENIDHQNNCIPANFSSGKASQSLSVQYRLFNDICSCWVVSEK